MKPRWRRCTTRRGRPPRTRRVEYGEFKPDSFVLAGMQGLKIFIMAGRRPAAANCAASPCFIRSGYRRHHGAGRAWRWPTRSTDFPDANAAPAAGRRSVEYATAIAVSSQGDFLTLGEVTEDCRSIIVPHLGQAARIATDKSADLALLRVYGARNLTAQRSPAPGDGSGNLTLVGVADPLAQAGQDAVTRTRRR